MLKNPKSKIVKKSKSKIVKKTFVFKNGDPQKIPELTLFVSPSIAIHLDTKRWLAVSCRSNRGRWCGWFLVNWFDDWSIGIWPVTFAASAFINKSEFWLVAFRGVLGSLFFDPADSGRLLLKFKLTWDDRDAPEDDFRSVESGCSTISRNRPSDVEDCDP